MISKEIFNLDWINQISAKNLNDKEIIRFKEPMQVKDWIIKNPLHTKLNKLKKSNPEAFFYWYQVYLLERKIISNG